MSSTQIIIQKEQDAYRRGYTEALDDVFVVLDYLIKGAGGTEEGVIRFTKKYLWDTLFHFTKDAQ